MKKRNLNESGSVATHAPTREWIEIETQASAIKNEMPVSLDVRIGSCVVSISHGFNKSLLAEICKVLLSL